MDDEIDQVIPEKIKFMEVIVEAEGQIGKRSGDLVSIYSVKGLLYAFLVKSLKLYIGI